jgi:hypothetical protein
MCPLHAHRYLSNNKLSGSLPSQWSAMTSLEFLCVAYWLRACCCVARGAAGLLCLCGAWLLCLCAAACRQQPSLWRCALCVIVACQLQRSSCRLQARWMQCFVSLAGKRSFLEGLTCRRLGGRRTCPLHAHRDLENNKLSGSLPSQWSAMRSLNHLCVAYWLRACCCVAQGAAGLLCLCGAWLLCLCATACRQQPCLWRCALCALALC